MKTIILNNGMEAKVDDDDFEYLSKWKWKFHKSYGCDGGYAARTCYYKERKAFGVILMHRLLNKTPINMFTDHINGNKLDNRKQNLRTVSAVSNMQNRGKQKNNMSGFRGLSWDKNRNKWIASFVFNKKTILRKRFQNKEDAILAIQNAQKECGVFPPQQPELL